MEVSNAFLFVYFEEGDHLKISLKTRDDSYGYKLVLVCFVVTRLYIT